jgi:TRAP-type C4-dicarboxylate transport system substrate-binding protein
MRPTQIVLAACLAAGLLPSAAAAQTRWDLASPFVPTNYHVENLVQFAADVDKATQGQLKITVHANSTLFKANEIKRAVQGGQIQAGEILMVAHENESGVLGVDGIPFLVTSYDAARRLYQVQRPVLEKYLERQGLVLLYCVPWPASGIYTRRAVNTMADMRGVKWRAYSPATTRMGELMGAQPVTVQAAELSQALATGVVEAFMTSSQTGVDSRVYEQVKYFYDLQAALPKNAVFVQAAAFRALNPAQQSAVRKAAAHAEARGWAASMEWNERSKKTLAAKGMEVVPPSAGLAADAQQMGRALLQEWRKRAGAEGEAIVADYQRGVAQTSGAGAPETASQGGARQ